MNKPIFQSTFLPPVQQIVHMMNAGEIIIELHDHYSKQTFRNRMQIAGPNGIQNLSIPVSKPNGSHTKMKDIKINNEKPWQEQIYKSIRTAYQNSPFYEFYIDDFLPFFKNKYSKLTDLNHQILLKVFEILEFDINISFTQSYIHEYNRDFRNTIHPKPQFREADPAFQPATYHQIFEDKYGFIPNMSIVDLIFNEGPLSYFYLKKSIKKKSYLPKNY